MLLSKKNALEQNGSAAPTLSNVRFARDKTIVGIQHSTEVDGVVPTQQVGERRLAGSVGPGNQPETLCHSG